MVGSNTLHSGVVALGATAMAAQIVIMRESLSLAYGNELVIGLALGSWLLLTGIGAYLARWFAVRTHAVEAALGVVVLSSLLPVATVIAGIVLRLRFFPPGTMLDLWSLLIGFTIVLLPFCIISGAGFVLFTGALAVGEGVGNLSGLVGRVYGLEALGSFFGGLSMSIVMILQVPSLDALILLLLADLGIAFWIAWKQRLRFWILAIGLLGVCAIVGRVLHNPDWNLREHLYAGQGLLEYRNAPLGALAVTRHGEQINVFQNNVLVGSTDDVVVREESVHYAMVQRAGARNVLVVSGGVSGTLGEFTKYPAAHVDFLESEPALVDILLCYGDETPPVGVTVVVGDAPRFVRRVQTSYDVVMLNLPDPATIQINRHFTVEFFRNVKRKLTPDGVLSWGISSSADYLGEEARQVRSVLFATARAVFRNVTIIPGQKDYFLASDGLLTVDIAKAVDNAGISNVYVNRWYIDDARLKERSAEMLRSIDGHAPVNSDFSPISTWWQLKFWLRYVDSPMILPVAFMFAGLLILTFRGGAVGAGIFATGYGGMTLEVVLLLGFQIICGYLHQMIGLLLTVFMGGLFLGTQIAGRRNRNATTTTFAVVMASSAMIAFILPSLLGWIRDMGFSDVAVYPFFFMSITGVAVLGGYAFDIAGRLEVGRADRIASGLYSRDVAGSAASAFLVGAYFIPSLGITWTSWIAGVLLLCTAGLALVSGRTQK
jgi:spermidine synthase